MAGASGAVAKMKRTVGTKKKAAAKAAKARSSAAKRGAAGRKFNQMFR